MECGGLQPLFLLPRPLVVLTNATAASRSHKHVGRRKSGSKLPHSKSAALKFRSAQHQPGNDAQINLLARIIELGLQNLRIIELFLKRFHRRRSRLTAEKNLYGAVERRLRIA